MNDCHPAVLQLLQQDRPSASSKTAFFKPEHKSKTPFPSLEQLCSSACTREPSTERFIAQFPCISCGDAGSAEAGWCRIFWAACPAPGIPPGPHSRASGRVWILASLQRFLPSQTVDPIFWCRCVWCLISMCIFGCYFLCMCWFSNRCFLFQEILNEPSFLWRCIHTATAQTHANFVYISQAVWQKSSERMFISLEHPPVA